MDIKTGVDAQWVAESNLALKIFLEQARGESVEENVDLAVAYADAMAAKRAERGGIRKDDPREMLLVAQEFVPTVISFFEKLAQLEKKHHHGDDG